MMNDIFAKDLSGEMVSPDEPGYDELITDIFATIKTATEMNTGYRTHEEVHEYMERILDKELDATTTVLPLGFDISDKAVRRAGLDYWSKLDVTVYESYEDFLEKNPGAKIYYATTKGPQTYVDVQYEEDCFIMFGKESAGIPEDILYDNQETAVRIPMINDIRSLNLSNSVAIVLYEALRQNNFDHMQLAGHLRTHEWR